MATTVRAPATGVSGPIVPRRRRRLPRWSDPASGTVLAAIAGGLTTVAILAVDDLSFAYPVGDVRVAVETATALLAGLATGLLIGCARAGRRLDQAVLTAALGVLCLGAAVPVAVAVLAPGLRIWVVMYPAILTGGVLLCAAAGLPPVRPARPWPAALAVTALTAACLAVSAVVLLRVLADPPPLADVATRHPGAPFLGRPAGILGIHLAGVALFALAAVLLARRARAGGDGTLAWLAAGSALLAAERLQYFLYPPVPREWLHVGDVSRLAFAALVTVGLARAVRLRWREAAVRAAESERRRLACELHDGVAQELAFIRRRAPRLLAQPDAALGRELVAAADRASEEARRAISSLLDPPSLAEGIEQMSRHAADREGVELVLALDRVPVTAPLVREALVRIAGEAIANAARHGGARSVRVELAAEPELALRIRDDGAGFDVAAAGGRGFGLTSMRERALAIDGRLTIRSRGGAGTEVEVRLP